MRIGTDLNASRLSRSLLPLTPSYRGQIVSLALIALTAGCNAVISFPDFKFGPHPGSKRDAGVADSGLAADGGGGEPTDGGTGGPDRDGGVTTDRDAGTVADASVSADSGTLQDSGVVVDAGEHDAGTGNSDSGVSCQSSAEVCDNGVDDDCDNQTDCDDQDCVGQTSCCSALPENTQLECGDHRDNDCNGKADCDDLNCSGTLACCVSSGAENAMLSCSDGVDDDCDGRVDCADPECSALSVCCGVVSEGGGGGTPSSACCTPDGLNETDAPNDGKDNDCDGLTDIPILQSAFPIQGLPASADEIHLTFMTEIAAGATLSCSTKRPGQTPSFAACPMMGTTVKPFTSLQSSDPMNNGLWITQVRWDFPDGKHSSSYTFRYYVHNSLNAAPHCSQFHTDAQYFALAATRLGAADAGAFKLGVDTFLSSPFIRVKYQVPISGNPKYQLNGETPSIDMWSLRRRFTVNATNRYLLITRNYKARRNPTSCVAGTIRVHVTHWSNTPAARNTFHSYSCDAIVLNRAGVGVCMDNGPTSVAGPKFTSLKDSYDSSIFSNSGSAPSSDVWPSANKFMWRNLMEMSDQGYRNFTTKCATTPCANGLYVPDRSQFSP